VSGAAHAQPDGVKVTGLRNAVDKSYRRMVDGMNHFEQRHELAPAAALRFKLLPRNAGTRMQDVEVAILGESLQIPIAVAPDHTFSLERNSQALKENASVRPNRRKQTLTWRAEIRTPGLAPGTRRLGDLRLECEVGMVARLISNYRPSMIGYLLNLFPEGPEYCAEPEPRYLFFADRPVWAVTLVSGSRRETLSVDRLYAGASRDPGWKADLKYCDCEVLADRTYFMPLGDPTWPDDTRVEFEYMDASAEATGDSIVTGERGKEQVRAALGQATEIAFYSGGYEVWVYRRPLKEKEPLPRSELVLLFDRDGLLAKTRIRGQGAISLSEIAP
jgi:hypothetical protein